MLSARELEEMFKEMEEAEHAKLDAQRNQRTTQRMWDYQCEAQAGVEERRQAEEEQ